MSSQERLYASFVLDKSAGLEVALQAEQVIEATLLASPLQTVPTSVDFLEGIMQLRDDVLPVINLKKRFGLASDQYDPDAKVAVVHLHSRRYGLLFDDIREVLRVPDHCVERMDPVLVGEDGLVTDLITIDQGARTLELLELGNIFSGRHQECDTGAGDDIVETARPASPVSRYVIFRCGGREYGIPVEMSKEICFLSDIDETFQSGVVEGALQLRGHTIPVLNSHSLLGETGGAAAMETTRILVLQSDELLFGIIVDEVREIISIREDRILRMPGEGISAIVGICEYVPSRNILLLAMENLLEGRLEQVKSMARLRGGDEDLQDEPSTSAHHLITENCYLIFSIGNRFAVELKDVQEILETAEILPVPDENNLVQGVINLRGVIVPVLDLHTFYGCNGKTGGQGPGKLIIGQYGGQRVALVVDEIVTIYKQEEFHHTPSLRPELQHRKDTLDRLIEFIDENGLKQHVLIVNVENILRYHLNLLEKRENE